MAIRGALLAFLFLFAQPSAPTSGILIRNARLVDGTGTAARRADVRIAGDTVAAIADRLEPRAGERVIDAGGQVLAPGFIDMHRHADRGVVAVGKKADLVVFDPDTIQDHGTPANPSAPPTGISYVVVNGALVLDDGTPTKARPGRALKRAS